MVSQKRDEGNIGANVDAELAQLGVSQNIAEVVVSTQLERFTVFHGGFDC